MKATILEKIKNLTWFNLVELLQDILSNLSKRIEYLEVDSKDDNSIEQGISEAPIDGNKYERQDGTWVIAGGGTTPNLDEVLTEGNQSSLNIDLLKDDKGVTYETILSPQSLSISNNSPTEETTLITSNSVVVENNEGKFTSIGSAGGISAAFLGQSSGNLNYESLSWNNLTNNSNIRLNPDYLSTVPEIEYQLTIPAKNGTIATLDDISLQSIVDNDGTANIAIKDNSFSLIGYGTGATASTTFLINNGLSGVDAVSNLMAVSGSSATLSNEINNGEDVAQVLLSNGGLTLKRQTGIITTEITIDEPSVNSSIKFPNPVVTGTYEIAITPSVDVIPTGDFTIPNGNRVRIITLTEAIPQQVTLPAISDSVGAIYYIFNGSTSTVNVVSKTGSTDISDNNTLSASTSITTVNNKLVLINDGLNFKVL